MCPLGWLPAIILFFAVESVCAVQLISSSFSPSFPFRAAAAALS